MVVGFSQSASDKQTRNKPTAKKNRKTLIDK
jgi:hypothetical protein